MSEANTISNSTTGNTTGSVSWSPDIDWDKARKEFTEIQKDAHRNGVCPHCGYCRHCGRGGSVPYYPAPSWPYTPWYPTPYWTYTTSTGNINCSHE